MLDWLFGTSVESFPKVAIEDNSSVFSRWKLNKYGEYFFSNENMHDLEQLIALNIVQYTGMNPGPQSRKNLYAFMYDTYEVYGHVEYPTKEENTRLVEKLNAIVVKEVTKNMLLNIQMQAKQVKRRDRTRAMLDSRQFPKLEPGSGRKDF